MSATCPNLELKNLTFWERKNEILTTTDMYRTDIYIFSHSRPLAFVTVHFPAFSYCEIKNIRELSSNILGEMQFISDKIFQSNNQRFNKMCVLFSSHCYYFCTYTCIFCYLCFYNYLFQGLFQTFVGCNYRTQSIALSVEKNIFVRNGYLKMASVSGV